MKVLAALILVLVASCQAAPPSSLKVRYDHYRIYQVFPQSSQHISLLRSMQKSNKYDFWNNVGKVGSIVAIKVAPDQFNDFTSFLTKNGIEYTCIIPNLQSLIDVQLLPPNRMSNDIDPFLQQYHDLDDINAYLTQMADQYPQISVIKGGNSWLNKDILGVKISSGSGKDAIIIEAGSRGREWLAPATALYFISTLVSSDDANIKAIATSYDWYIFPVTNPDGYDYTWTTDPEWHNNRHQYEGQTCVGVDLNRNWDYHWSDEDGFDSDPCGKDYSGPSAFSEPETKTLSDYISQIASSQKIFAFFSFHNWSQYLLIPYGYTEQQLDNYNETYAIGKDAVASIAKRYGTQYELGTIFETDYTSSMGSVDWVKGVQHVRIVYNIVMRDADGAYGFRIPPEQIIPNGEEVMDGIVTILQEAAKLPSKH